MITDEQIKVLADNLTRLEGHLTRLEGIVQTHITAQMEAHERANLVQAKNEALMAKVLNSIIRLENNAVSHEMRLDGVEAILARLEGKPPRKPQ